MRSAHVVQPSGGLCVRWSPVIQGPPLVAAIYLSGRRGRTSNQLTVDSGLSFATCDGTVFVETPKLKVACDGLMLAEVPKFKVSVLCVGSASILTCFSPSFAE